MPRPLRTVLFAAALSGLAACGGDASAPTAPSPTATTPTPAQPSEASEASDTTKVRAASAIGYDGAALQATLDRARAQAADEAKQTDAAARAANGSP